MLITLHRNNVERQMTYHLVELFKTSRLHLILALYLLMRPSYNDLKLSIFQKNFNAHNFAQRQVMTNYEYESCRTFQDESIARTFSLVSLQIPELWTFFGTCIFRTILYMEIV